MSGGAGVGKEKAKKTACQSVETWRSEQSEQGIRKKNPGRNPGKESGKE